eukprot:567294-Pyramimonas_sp.AAC.1
MAPKALAAKLSMLVPTPEEIEAARKTIEKADKAKAASMKAGMKHHLKNNPDENIRTPSDREKFMEHFLVVQLCSKESTVTSSSSRQVSTKKRRTRDVYWCSKEIMDQKVGALKADHWRQSGLIKARPDMLTGSTHPDHVEWPVPVEWESMSEEELKKFWLDVSSEGADDHETLSEMQKRGLTLDGVGALNTAYSSGGADAKVKIEPESAESNMARRVVEVQRDCGAILKEFQDRLLLARQTHKKASDEARPYEVQFVSDLSHHIKKTTKLAQILDKMAIYETKSEEVPKVIESMDACRAKDESLREWFVKYGYCSQKEVTIKPKK